MASKDSNKFTMKDLYNELWHCRDFELKHLWQRSIFLGTFLVGIAAMYGIYIKDMFICIFNCGFQNNFAKEYFVLFIGLFLTILGIVFSILWIAMAKGSKAWYELYETGISILLYKESIQKKIYDTLSDKGFKFPEVEGDWINKSLFDEKDFNEQNISHLPLFGKLKGCSDDFDSFILSPKSGGYSPSKINVAIGIVAFITWSLLCVFHIIFCVIFVICHYLYVKSIIIIIFSIVIFLVYIGILVLLIFSRFLKSSTLKECFDKK